MKNFVNIAFNGYPESNVDSIVRGFTKDKQLVIFDVSPAGTKAATGGQALKVPDDLGKINDLKTLINFLKGVSLEIQKGELTLESLPPNGAKYITSAPVMEAVSGTCTADGGCGADGCAGYVGCAARNGCGADGCGGYVGCAADAGCAARGCAGDAGCGANVSCVADACVGHACGADLCPANVNIGPCAVDVPVCPIIL
ncbi:hypothetical protein [Heliomicrobium gestii]|nr:hypothetical protein [Heliomicrobium gestii]MBM7865669.1 hypothetical protein [Heliomicrobium gestii]